MWLIKNPTSLYHLHCKIISVVPKSHFKWSFSNHYITLPSRHVIITNTINWKWDVFLEPWNMLDFVQVKITWLILNVKLITAHTKMPSWKHRRHLGYIQLMNWLSNWRWHLYYFDKNQRATWLCAQCSYNWVLHCRVLGSGVAFLCHTLFESVAQVNTDLTRQHSSRMRTARVPTILILVATTGCQYWWRGR